MDKIPRTILVCLATGMLSCSGSLPESKSSDEAPELDSSDINQTPDPGVPTEDLVDVSCPVERCFIVEPNSEYCSIDPTFPPEESGHFATKSRIKIASGNYELSGESGTLADFPVSLFSPFGEENFAPEGDGLGYEFKLTDTEEVFHTRKDASSFVSSNARISRLRILAPRTKVWHDYHHRLGNPDDIWWWLNAQRLLVANMTAPSPLFPGLSVPAEVRYGPCNLSGRPDDVFSFTMEDGDELELIVRSFTTQVSTGHYLGRLLSAKGSLFGEAVDIEDQYKLAFLGSEDHGQQFRPVLVIQTSSEGESCGIIFDPEISGDDGLHEWAAFRLTCDDKRGERIPLTKVTHPPEYVAS